MNEQNDTVADGHDFLSRAAGAANPRVELLFLPTLKCEVGVREMVAEERDWLDRQLAKGKHGDTRALVVAAALANADGSAMYPMGLDAGEPTFPAGVVDKVKKMPGKLVERIFRVACHVNGIGELDGVDGQGK